MAEALLGGAHSTLHGPHGQPCNVCGLRVGAVGDPDEHEDETKPRLQRGECVVKSSDLVLVGQPGVGLRRRGRPTRVPKGTEPLQRAAAAAPLAPTETAGDREEPVFDRRPGAIARGRAPRGQERLLREVLGEVPVAGQGVQEPDDASTVGVIEQPKRLGVALRHTGHETLGVRGVGRGDVGVRHREEDTAGSKGSRIVPRLGPEGPSYRWWIGS